MIVLPSLLNILCLLSFEKINPKIISSGRMNDFPKLLRIIDIKSGLVPSILVIFKLKIFFLMFVLFYIPKQSNKKKTKY